MTVLIAGGGIAGLTLALTLHQIGLPFRLLEGVRHPKPLGVGINLQPPAVRELLALGLGDLLDRIGVRTSDYGFYTRTGVEIWTEPRGTDAGYHWPQYSVHRGQLQMGLLQAVLERCGSDAVSFGCRIEGYEQGPNSVTLSWDGGRETAEGAMAVAADGIHSALRAQMYPNEGAPVWGGAIMWRGTSLAKPFLSGRSMILAGNDRQRFVSYPISEPNPGTGRSVINWIAEARVAPSQDVGRGDWNQAVSIERFADRFADWRFDWIDIPGLIASAQEVFEYPMVDRDPVEQWTDGRVTLIGDAAHATYPVGSSGASQAILDARVLGAELLSRGPGHEACAAFESQVRPMANAVTLANRAGGGPDAIMQIAEDRCAGDFSKLDAVLPQDERANHAARFKALAGIGVAETNARPAVIQL